MYLKRLNTQLAAQDSQLFLTVAYAFNEPFLQTFLFSNHPIQEVLQERKQPHQSLELRGGKSPKQQQQFQNFNTHVLLQRHQH